MLPRLERAAHFGYSDVTHFLRVVEELHWNVGVGLEAELALKLGGFADVVQPCLVHSLKEQDVF